MQHPDHVFEQHPIVSSNRGMVTYPVGTELSFGSGDHINGVTVMSWLTEHFIRSWGEAWATGGWMSTRFRSHLTEGLDLITSIELAADSMSLTVADASGLVFATAEAALLGPVVVAPGPPGQVPTVRARPGFDELHGRTLMPLEFTFDAPRDLAFATHLADGDFWRDREWAHPAWVATSANAIIRRNIDFREPFQWVHSGLALWMHAPIRHGAHVRLAGRITDTFDGRRHRFAVAALEATVDEVVVATMRSTFAYGPALGGLSWG